MFGNVTRKNVCNDDAPSVRAASSSFVPSSSSTGPTSRITNGMQMKSVTRIIEGSAKMIWTPRAAKNWCEPAPRSEQQHRHQTHRDRRNRERQLHQRVQQTLTGEVITHENPRGQHPEHGRKRRPSSA